MCEAYMKQLVANGGGKFSVVRLSAETEEALNVKRDIYLGDDFQDATKEDYDAQFTGRTAPVAAGSEDAALGTEEKKEEGAEDKGEDKADEAAGTAPDQEA